MEIEIQKDNPSNEEDTNYLNESEFASLENKKNIYNKSGYKKKKKLKIQINSINSLAIIIILLLLISVFFIFKFSQFAIKQKINNINIELNQKNDRKVGNMPAKEKFDINIPINDLE